MNTHPSPHVDGALATTIRQQAAGYRNGDSSGLTLREADDRHRLAKGVAW